MGFVEMLELRESSCNRYLSSLFKTHECAYDLFGSLLFKDGEPVWSLHGDRKFLHQPKGEVCRPSSMH